MKFTARLIYFISFFVGNILASGITGSTSAAPKLKLVYFDAKGAAEMARILMKIGDVPFEDFRYPIKTKEGGGFETTEFTAAKTAGELTPNMDRVPILYVDDIPIGQSKAIERYISHRCNLMGKSDIEAVQIDCVTEHVRDIKEKWGKIRFMGGFGPNPEKDAAMKKWFDEGELTEWLIKLEKSLPPSQEDGYAVGSSTSYADICIWNLICDYFDNKEGIAKSAKPCERLCKIAEKVGELDPVKSWLSERPQTMF